MQLRFVNIHKCMCPGAQTQLIILAQPAGGRSSSLGWRIQLIPLDLHRLEFQIYACLKKGSTLSRNIIGFRSLINHRSCKNTASGSLLLAASPCRDGLRRACWEQHPQTDFSPDEWTARLSFTTRPVISTALSFCCVIV